MTYSVLEFLVWKHNFEKNTLSSYSKRSGDLLIGGCTVRYYTCNRTGFYRSRAKSKIRRKSMKPQGKLS